MNDTLTKAYELIESEQMSQAREILESFLAHERNNADAWWLYAHAVPNIDEAQTALANVKRIAPNYPGVDELIEQMNVRLAQIGEGAQIQQFDSYPTEIEDEAFEPDFDDLDAPNDDFDFEDDELEPEIVERAPWTRYLVYVLILVLVLFAGFILLFGRGNDDNDENTSTNVVNTTPPFTETTEEPFVASSASFLENLSQNFELASSDIELKQTQLGETAFVVFCSDVEAFRQVITDAVIAMGEVSANLDTNAIGIRIIDCTTGEPLNTLVVETSVAQQYA
ncbi:MAG: tetratricopeptide repeat protein, partial [Chloroflexi bacterium]